MRIKVVSYTIHVTIERNGWGIQGRETISKWLLLIEMMWILRMSPFLNPNHIVTSVNGYVISFIP